MDHTCPICKKKVNLTGQEKKVEQGFYPFCSQRCKLVDLGSWLDSDYKFVSPHKTQENDQDFDLPE